MGSLEQADAEVAAVTTAPRVTLQGLKDRIVARYSFPASRATIALDMPSHEALDVLTICVVVLDNGWTLVGKSAPADPANYNEALGDKLAFEDCIRQLWPLEGYLLRNRLADEGEALASKDAPRA